MRKLIVMAAGVFALAGCETPPSPENRVFSSVEQCVASNGTFAECQFAHQEAQSTAYTFVDESICVSNFVTCELHENEYRPVVVAFSLGARMDNGQRAPSAAYAGVRGKISPANTTAETAYARGVEILARVDAVLPVTSE